MLRWMILAAGLGQLALAIASLAIPRALGWREDTAGLRPLTRQVFWTYAGYIWCAHVAFGLLSALAPGLLLDGTPLAGIVCAFIAAWWGARLAIQLIVFDRSARPRGPIFAAAEVALVGAFVAFTGVYAAAAWKDLTG